MRLLRWAVDHAVSPQEDEALAGIAILTTLLGSDLLQRQDEKMVRDVAVFVARHHGTDRQA